MRRLAYARLSYLMVTSTVSIEEEMQGVEQATTLTAAELESRFSFSFAYALFKATVMYLTTLSLGWL